METLKDHIWVFLDDLTYETIELEESISSLDGDAFVKAKLIVVNDIESVMAEYMSDEETSQEQREEINSYFMGWVAL